MAQHEHKSLEASIIQAFRRFDEENAGSLTRHQLKCAFVALTGSKPSKQQVQLIMRQCGVVQGEQEEERVGWEQFHACMLALLEGTRDPDEHMRQVFKSFDQNGRGFISRTEAHQVFKQVMHAINGRVVDQVFDELDTDRDGRVTYREFINMMHQRLPA